MTTKEKHKLALLVETEDNKNSDFKKCVKIQDFEDVLSKKFSIGSELTSRGYIFPNGKNLALNSYVSHAQVLHWLIDNGCVEEYDGIYDGGCPPIEDLGCIRTNLDSEGFVMLSIKEPTTKQYEVLLDFFDKYLSRSGQWRYSSDLMIFTPHQKSDFAKISLTNKVSDDIVDIIKNYYRTGRIVESKKIENLTNIEAMYLLERGNDIDLKEELIETSEFDVYVYESPYQVKNKLLSSNESFRIFIDEKTSLYLLGLSWETTHTEMIDVANENGFNTRFDDFDKNKICLVFVPKGEEEIYFSAHEAQVDDYDTQYEYDKFFIYSRYQDFSKFKLSNILGKYKKRRIKNINESKEDKEKFAQWAKDSELVNMFWKNQKRLKDKDIYIWMKKSPDELRKEIEKLPKTDREIKSSGYDKLAENEEYTLFKIKTYEGAVKLGKGTQWCISSIKEPILVSVSNEVEYNPPSDDNSDNIDEYNEEWIIDVSQDVFDRYGEWFSEDDGIYDIEYEVVILSVKPSFYFESMYGNCEIYCVISKTDKTSSNSKIAKVVYADGDVQYFDANDVMFNDDTTNNVPKSALELFRTINESLKEEKIEIEKDSQGNELTAQQSGFFKNSKVRDEKNRLLVVYHGTSEQFDDETFKSSINWFTTGPDYAKGFGTWTGKKGFNYQCYLSCSKIFDCGLTDGPIFGLMPTKPYKFSSRFESIFNKLNTDEKLIRNMIEEVANEFDEKENGYKMKINVLTRSSKFRNLLVSQGYDCMRCMENGNVITFGVFNANQIKSIDNKSPTISNNINESTQTNEFEPYTAGYILDDGSLLVMDEYHGEEEVREKYPEYSNTHPEEDTCVRIFERPNDAQYKRLEEIIDYYLDNDEYCKVEIRKDFYNVYSLRDGACEDPYWDEKIGNWTGYKLVQIIKNYFNNKVNESTDNKNPTNNSNINESIQDRPTHVRFINKNEYDVLNKNGEVIPVDTGMRWSGKKSIFTFPLSEHSIKEYFDIAHYLNDAFDTNYSYAVLLKINENIKPILTEYDVVEVESILDKELNFDVMNDGDSYLVPEVRLTHYSKDNVVDIKRISEIKLTESNDDVQKEMNNIITRWHAGDLSNDEYRTQMQKLQSTLKKEKSEESEEDVEIDTNDIFYRFEIEKFNSFFQSINKIIGEYKDEDGYLKDEYIDTETEDAINDLERAFYEIEIELPVPDVDLVDDKINKNIYRSAFTQFGYDKFKEFIDEIKYDLEILGYKLKKYKIQPRKIVYKDDYQIVYTQADLAQVEKYINESKADTENLINFVGDTLANKFISLKSKFKSPENDIYYWLKKEPKDLEKFITDYEKVGSKTQQKQEIKQSGSEVIFEDDTWKVLTITSYRASVYYGHNTKWCISMKNSGKYWQDFTSRGIKFYFYFNKKNNKKYALSLYPEVIQTSDASYNFSLFDEADNSISEQYLSLNLPSISSLNLIYNIKQDIIENGIIKYINSLTCPAHYEVPDNIKEIGFKAFSYCHSLKSITLPDSLKEIGDVAFYNCKSLKSIIIPNSVEEIGIHAFAECKSLKSIIIPNSVTRIGFQAFAGCSSLTSINIPSSVVFLAVQAFAECQSLKSIVCETNNEVYQYLKSEYGDKVILKEEESLLTESKADEQKLIDFAGNSLAKRFLLIKNRLKSPENDMYYWLKKSPIELEDRVNEVESTVSKTKQKEIDKTEGAELVVEENGWKVYRIDSYEASCLYGKGTKWCTASTETSSYFNDYKRKGVKLYYFIKNNEKYALALYSKIIVNSKKLGIKSNYELYDATDKLIIDFNQIKSLNLPEIPGVKLTFELLPTKIENGVLIRVYPYNQGEFVIPNSVTSIGNGAFFNCTSLTSITIPSSVNEIGENAFFNCTSLKSITISNSVTSIGSFAFSTCTSLTSITIPNSVTKISDGAFSNCTSLTSITIPNSVTKISDDAFSNCTSLKSITIPNSVTSIGNYAFYNCTSLTSITIPNSVTSIGEKAFYNCPSLTIYAEAPSKPTGWNAYWNPNNRPVVWGTIKKSAKYYTSGDKLEESISNKEKESIDKLDELFGQEEPYIWSTYILPNGHFLNPENYKADDEWLNNITYEHEDYYIVFNDDNKNYNVLEDYCIKVNVTYPYVAMPNNRATPEQFLALRKLIDRRDEFEYSFDEISDRVENGSDVYDMNAPLIIILKNSEIAVDLDSTDVNSIVKMISRAYTTGTLLTESTLNEAKEDEQKLIDFEEIDIPFEDIGLDASYETIKDDSYNTNWYYFGDCISTVDGNYPDEDDEEYWDYYGPEGAEEDAPYWDATEMAQALEKAKVYLGKKNLIDAPKEALAKNVVCGVIQDRDIGFIYNIDNDIHYFFDIDSSLVEKIVKEGIKQEILNNLNKINDLYSDSYIEDLKNEDDFNVYVWGKGVSEFDVDVLVNKKLIRFKSVHIKNNTQNNGIAMKLIDAILSALEDDWTIEVIANINASFWNHIASKYSHLKWVGLTDVDESLVEKIVKKGNKWQVQLTESVTYKDILILGDDLPNIDFSNYKSTYPIKRDLCGAISGELLEYIKENVDEETFKKFKRVDGGFKLDNLNIADRIDAKTFKDKYIEAVSQYKDADYYDYYRKKNILWFFENYLKNKHPEIYKEWLCQPHTFITYEDTIIDPSWKMFRRSLENIPTKDNYLFDSYYIKSYPIIEKIVKKGSKYQVQSEKGKNLETYGTKEEAEKRLQQVHYFKYINEESIRNGYDKLVYRVDLFSGDRSTFKDKSVFFADSLEYFDYSDTGYSKEEAKEYYLNLKDFKVFDPMIQWKNDIGAETWSIIRTSEEFANKNDLYITDYLDGIDYEDPNVYHEVLIDTDSLAEYGRQNGYDVTILRDIASDGGRGPLFTEYAVHNSNAVKIKDAKVFNKENPNINEEVESLQEDLQETDNEGNILSKEQIEFFKNSKVRENGKLQVVYHGTNKYFDTFKYNSKNNNKKLDFGKAFYFTDDLSIAKDYSEGKVLMSCYLNLQNPLVVDAKGMGVKSTQHTSEMTKYINDNGMFTLSYPYEVYFHQAKKEGRDGIIVHNIIDNHSGSTDNIRPTNVYIAFNEVDIKSITNKTPTNSNNINESEQADKRDEIEDRVMKDLGTSSEPIDGPSYIMRDGSFLKIWKANVDISGMSGGKSVSGKAQHLDVDGYIGKHEQQFRVQYYLNHNCIRVNTGFEEYMVMSKVRPNSKQFDSLLKWLDYYFINHSKIHVLDWFGSHVNSKVYYAEENSPEDIIKKIKRYYATGTLVESDFTDNEQFVYHGSPMKIDKFKGDVVWFTDNIYYAREYTRTSGQVSEPSANGYIYKCTIDVKRPFDIGFAGEGVTNSSYNQYGWEMDGEYDLISEEELYNWEDNEDNITDEGNIINPKLVSIARQLKTTPEYLISLVGEDAFIFNLVYSKEFIKLLKSRNYDSITQTEQAYTIGVFNVDKIKIVEVSRGKDDLSEELLKESFQLNTAGYITEDDDYAKEMGIFDETDNDTLNESKQDREKFAQWAGKELADRYFKQKAKMKPPYNDITWVMKNYTSKKEFEEDVYYYEQIPTRSDMNKKGKEGAKLIYSDKNWNVYKIDTYEAAVKYGKNTQWCLTGTNTSVGDDISVGREHYNHYIEEGYDLYYYINKIDNDKYALIYADDNDWQLFDSADFLEVCSNMSSPPMETWNPHDTQGYHPDFPKVKGLPDINKVYDDYAKEVGIFDDED